MDIVYHKANDRFSPIHIRDPLLMIFYAEWCAISRTLIEQLLNNTVIFPDLLVLAISIDEYPELAAFNDVRCVPHFVYHHNKGVITTTDIQIVDDLIKWIDGIGKLVNKEQ